MAKCNSSLLSWFLIILLVLLQTQTGNGSNTASKSEKIKLRVGVPQKNGFPQFVNVVPDSHDPKKYIVTGYCMDVFHAVVNHLPFDVSLDVQPYLIESKENSGTYDTLLQQIPTKFDVVVGDITILANRSNFVDFTLPYTGSGFKMLVKVQHGRQQTMWIFVKPFSWDLWLSIVMISTFIGVTILIMERNVNALPNQDGSPNPRKLSIATILWFPISQAILPERQVVAMNCSRFVLMIWLLLAFVLMQSYTANLTSILTLDQLRPSFLNVNDLKKGGYYVGYQTGSFVYDVLVHQFKFDPLKLKSYNTSSEYRDALNNGNGGGGVAAIFDEVPYLKVYLQEYGSNYILAGPRYRNDGFGFAFPLNSNLTTYFSRAILNVTESELMNDIEEIYFGKNDIGGEDPSTEMSSAPLSLTFHSFEGLFLITGIATLLALLVSETVIWQRPILMAKAFSQRYLFPTSPSTETPRVHPTQDSTHGIETTQTGNGSYATSKSEVINLRVGVPQKDGFRQFVNVVWDSHHENKHNVSGFCMEVFNAVVNHLPFNVSLDVQPYPIESNDNISRTYDQLLQQIPARKYDVVVGDVTILANRSNFVDFTLPYTASGVQMLVPVQHGRQQTVWIFVKPFSWDLWLSIVMISTFIGVAILIMERNVNALPNQDGSPNPRKLSVATILCFPISQAILPERQVVAMNCSRFVLMVWLLLAFVLMQSYTANLTSILTLDQLRPSFLNVNDLKKGGYYVGYQTGSFVFDVLVKEFKFDPHKLRSYNKSRDYHHALSIGSQGGGVAAIFDELPYLKVYLQEYKSNYILAGHRYRNAGFGFSIMSGDCMCFSKAFPLNSNLTAHFSRAILKVTESELMNEIEEKYFGKHDIGGEEASAQMSSSPAPSLTFHSFAGLFLITGIATLLALFVSETVIWQLPISMAKAYSKRYFFPTAGPRTQPLNIR
ncbi:Glutamate receptor 2.5, partial [Mucuna pruriens]